MLWVTVGWAITEIHPSPPKYIITPYNECNDPNMTTITSCTDMLSRPLK